MQFVVITGMSGAGKSTALKCLEDGGFYCVDNLPPALLPEFIKIFAAAGPGRANVEKAAFGIDIRVGVTFGSLFTVLDGLRNYGHKCSVIFLESSDETLVRRYKETRRAHPLAENDRIITGIEKEREMLSFVKQRADCVLDTTNLLTRQLKEEIFKICAQDGVFNSLVVNIVTFGFKYGIPEDSDLVFDVRFIQNPFYTDLRDFAGTAPEVREFVFNFPATGEFLNKTLDLIDFLLPRYVEEGKNKLVIGFGCTGGRHRSVCLGSEVYTHLKGAGQTVTIIHRDIEK